MFPFLFILNYSLKPELLILILCHGQVYLLHIGPQNLLLQHGWQFILLCDFQPYFSAYEKAVGPGVLTVIGELGLPLVHIVVIAGPVDEMGSDSKRDLEQADGLPRMESDGVLELRHL